MTFNNTELERRFERLLSDIDPLLSEDEKKDIIEWICEHGEYDLAFDAIVYILKEKDINLSLNIIQQIDELASIMGINIDDLYDDGVYN